MASDKKYWKSLEELDTNNTIVERLRNDEFVEELPIDEFLGNKESLDNSSTTRRDFLKFVGFTTVAASVAACEGPVVKSIPYVVKPEEVVPGVADFYASTMFDGFDFASILVKVREGRPIKIEPNKLAGGSTNARVQASVLSLYDNNRLKGPKINGKEIEWHEVDSQITSKLNQLSVEGKEIVILTGTLASPSTAELITNFKNKFRNVKHIQYDAVSESGAVEAFETMYGVRALPNYDFSKVETVVSFGADFLGDWQGGGFDADFAKTRVPKDGKMSKHIQFEANLSLTGANSDKRVKTKPSEQAFALINLYNKITESNLPSKNTSVDKEVEKAAKQLKAAGSKALVVCGNNDKNLQLLTLSINKALQSEVIDVVATRNIRNGVDSDVKTLVADMHAGKVGALLMYQTNPVYTMPASTNFTEALKKVTLTVAFSMNENETATVTQYALATPHYLESWGDVSAKNGNYNLIQPTINPLFNTNQFQDCLLRWTGSGETYYDYLKKYWEKNILTNASWNQTLHDGFYISSPKQQTSIKSVDLNSVASEINKNYNFNGFELVFYTKTGLGDGQMANNPWLQEFPDPITRTSWDNYATISTVDAKKLGLQNFHVSNGALNGSRVTITVGKTSLKEVPVFIQPGQAEGTIGLAVGYGRTKGMKQEMMTGVNAFYLNDGFKSLQQATIEKAVGIHEFACVQLHHTMMGRDIIKETTLETFNDTNVDPAKSWNKKAHVSLDHKNVEASTVTLWDEHDTTIGHRFNLSIDLNACTGCGACVIACHAENNVPVVGKAEIRNSRDMHWLRIDRYYSSDMNDDVAEELQLGVLDKFDQMEIASDNPEVAFQPVMCQHCNNAPCETVCPVAATTHGHQGQNQMTYNRCVGTRYCANNCPYKVRRFNWFKYKENDEFDYHMNDDLGRMVLNPDVVVRSRGVMEKCSMCIQKTQLAILEAKKDGRPIADGEFQTACSSACSSSAIVFGDVNDKTSQIAKLVEDQRAYHLLDAIGTKPNVVYQAKVRNTNES
ncbi:MAG: TAT-variant-translocated molybdopterin oxidoreductase [Bacteroidetes bacterium]|nr:TAT-variant-translocated molybdopterin oxidoreductase [Bacteroidota bacterium]